MEANLQILQDDRVKFHNNPLLGYLNINSWRNKVTDLRIIFKDLSLDYFVLSETKLDESFRPLLSLLWKVTKLEVERIEINTAEVSSNLQKMVLFVKQYLSTYLIKLNVFAQNLPFRRISGFVSVYTGHPYIVT